MIRQIINIVFPNYIRGLGVTAAVIGGVAAIGGAVIQSRSASKAADAQEEASEDAIAFQREALEQSRADLQPFRQAGENALPGLQRLTFGQEDQKQFVTNNPFFDALADDAQKRIFNNQAARGKVGSGGTAEALQNRLLLLGPQLVQQSIDNRFKLAQLGGNAAAGQANATLQTGGTISDLATQGGNAQAAGIIGRGNAIAGGIEGIASAAGGAFGGGFGGASTGSGTSVGQMFGNQTVTVSDERMKEDIEHVGELHNGLNVYTFRYKGEERVNIGLMAQEVEEIFPEAVHEINGIKHVNYGAIRCQ